MKIKEQWIAAIKKRPFLVKACEECGYDMRFSYVHGQLGLDLGCHCSGMDPGWIKKSEDYLEFYLLDREWIELIREFVKAVGAETPTELTDR